MGVNSVAADLEMNDAHNRDVKLSHFIKWEEKSGSLSDQGVAAHSQES